MNGTTNKDRTNYYETVPANQLEKVLWLEADRMGFLLDAVSQKKFEIQRATVKNERAQRIDNQPYGLVGEQVGRRSTRVPTPTPGNPSVMWRISTGSTSTTSSSSSCAGMVPTMRP
jgi:hypothetical protein